MTGARNEAIEIGRMASAFAAQGAEVDPRSTHVVPRVLRLRRGGRIVSGTFVPIVNGRVYRVVSIDSVGTRRHRGKTIKPGGYFVIYLPTDVRDDVDPHDSATWLFDYVDSGYSLERRLRKQQIWVFDVELPKLKGLTLGLSELVRMAIRMRKADKNSIAAVEAEARAILERTDDIGVRSRLLTELVGKLKGLVAIDANHLTSRYPVTWCSHERAERVAWRIRASGDSYALLADVVRCHNGIAQQLIRSWHDDLFQMVKSDGIFAAGHRAVRLGEYAEGMLRLKARPWSRVAKRCSADLHSAMRFCQLNDGECARNHVRVAVEALRQASLCDDLQGIVERMSIVAAMGVALTSDEMLALDSELAVLSMSIAMINERGFVIGVKSRICSGIVAARRALKATHRCRAERVVMAKRALTEGLAFV